MPYVRYAVLAVLTLLSPAAAMADLAPQNDQMYTGSDGIVHITGEVENNLKTPRTNLVIVATMYAADGQEVAKASARSPVNSLMPGMSAPFDILVPQKTADVARYSLEVQHASANPRDRSIGVEDSQMYRDGLGNLAISGSLVNNGASTANMVNVVATVYDSDGNVAGVSSSHIRPDYLRSSDEAYFTLAVPYAADGVSHYDVTAESEEYAAVPEFPAGTLLLLAGSVAWYVILGKKTRILQQPISA